MVWCGEFSTDLFWVFTEGLGSCQVGWEKFQIIHLEMFSMWVVPGGFLDVRDFMFYLGKYFLVFDDRILIDFLVVDFGCFDSLYGFFNSA